MRIDKKYYELNNLGFMDALYWDGNFIFYDIVSEKFCMFNMDKRNVKILKYINKGGEYAGYPRKIFKEEDNLYCVQSEDCVMYQFKLNGCSSIELLNRISFIDFIGKVKNAFDYDGNIWMIPTELRYPFVEYNLSKRTVKYYNFKDDLEDIDGQIREVAKKGSHLYLSIKECNKLIRINMDTKKLEIVSTNIKELIDGMAIRGTNIVLRAKYGKTIYSWNPDTRECKILAKSEDVFEEMGRLLVHSDGTIIVCPIKENDFFYVDENKGSIEKIVYKTELPQLNGGTFTIGTVEYNKSIYVYPWATNKMVEISKTKSVWIARVKALKMDSDEYANYIASMYSSEKIHYESDDMPLPIFFKTI